MFDLRKESVPSDSDEPGETNLLTTSPAVERQSENTAPRATKPIYSGNIALINIYNGERK